jgi:hypothetical protein
LAKHEYSSYIDGCGKSTLVRSGGQGRWRWRRQSQSRPQCGGSRALAPCLGVRAHGTGFSVVELHFVTFHRDQTEAGFGDLFLLGFFWHVVYHGRCLSVSVVLACGARM